MYYEGISVLTSEYSAGTPAFQSPEAVMAEKGRIFGGVANDIWAAGVTLYVFVHGRAATFCTQFTCFTSTKVQILTLWKAPVLFPPLRGNKCNASLAGVM